MSSPWPVVPVELELDDIVEGLSSKGRSVVGGVACLFRLVVSAAAGAVAGVPRGVVRTAQLRIRPCGIHRGSLLWLASVGRRSCGSGCR